jgi:hypothetical protein
MCALVPDRQTPARKRMSVWHLEQAGGEMAAGLGP